MAEVLSISTLHVDADGCCDVFAVVEDAVEVRRQTRWEPAEYGPALCRGSFYISDDEVMPVDADSQLQFVADRIDYWQVVDQSDCE
jgi:hypothetical protein